MDELKVEYEVWFVDDLGSMVEWCAASTDFSDAMHYAFKYAQDGDTGVFKVTRERIQWDV